MLKTIGLTFLGLFLGFCGFYLAYFFIIGIDRGRTPLLLLPSVILVGIGVYLLLKAGKSDSTVMKTLQLNPNQLATEEASNSGGLANVLERNNAMVQDFAKTTKARDELKMLQVSAAAEEKAAAS